ncbi:unnamed protein product, partial [Aphanomyces euteiches]
TRSESDDDDFLSAPSAAHVLTSHELLLHISDYQDGMYHVNHPLQRQLIALIPKTLDEATILNVDTVLSPWYARHGIQRLHTLLSSSKRSRVHDLIASHAAYYGHVNVLEELFDGFPRMFISHHLLEWTARSGQLKAIQFLHEQHPLHGRPSSTLSALDYAATNGHLDAVVWLHNNRADGASVHAMNGAARNGHLNILEWLEIHTRGGWTNLAVDDAASNGHLEVVQWLHARRPDAISHATIERAAQNGHLVILQWLFSKFSVGCSPCAMDKAAANGHVAVVEWLHSNGHDCSTNAMDSAAENGHVHVLEWLRIHRSEGCTTEAVHRAAQNGHVLVLQWLLDNMQVGLHEWNVAGMLEVAASNGHLAVAQWLEERMGVNLTEQDYAVAITCAAANRHLEFLRWMHGKPGWAKANVDGAVVHDHSETLKWLLENHIMKASTTNEAAEARHQDSMERLNGKASSKTLVGTLGIAHEEETQADLHELSLSSNSPAPTCTVQ